MGDLSRSTDYVDAGELIASRFSCSRPATASPCAPAAGHHTAASLFIEEARSARARVAYPSRRAHAG